MQKQVCKQFGVLQKTYSNLHECEGVAFKQPSRDYRESGTADIFGVNVQWIDKSSRDYRESDQIRTARHTKQPANFSPRKYLEPGKVDIVEFTR